jgi:hypothetical protein
MTKVSQNADGRNEILSEALGLAGLGWSVFPLHTPVGDGCSCGRPECRLGGARERNRGKHPRTTHGLKDAMTDGAVICGWWREWPDANVAVRTGSAAGLLMVGPDRGEEGLAALADLQRRNGKLPEGPRAKTGCGTHLYFAWPSGVRRIKNARNHRDLPIDVRAEGGYAVAPPSLHHSGVNYAWEVSPREAPAPQPPEWLVEWCLLDEDGQRLSQDILVEGAVDDGLVVVGGDDLESRCVAYLAGCPPAVSGRGGHSQTMAVARALAWEFNLGPRFAFDLLKRHYNPRCQPPWSDAELAHKCREAHEKPFGKPRGHLLLPDGQPVASSPTTAVVGEDDIDALPLPPEPPWPKPLREEAYHGVLGRIVRLVEPSTEADPVGILAQLLAAAGNAAGRGPFYQVDEARHRANLFLVLVGPTGRGRKGTSWNRARRVMELAQPAWLGCVHSGLATGQGLGYEVRDANPETGDPGKAEKRFFALEEEFAKVLTLMRAKDSTLSMMLRLAWDGRPLENLTRTDAARYRATNHHISAVAHTTLRDLARHLTEVELFNGFANRFLWLLVKRVRSLPDGGQVHGLEPLAQELGRAILKASTFGPMSRSVGAGVLWRSVYEELGSAFPVDRAEVVERSKAQVLRLSMLYALLDETTTIQEDHLRAALALWDYCEESARIIFSQEVPDPLADKVLEKLKAAGEAGLNRRELSAAFSRNVEAKKLLDALVKLRNQGRAWNVEETTGGRPGDRWRAGQKP